jgi:hypothetical protein
MRCTCHSICSFLAASCAVSIMMHIRHRQAGYRCPTRV